MENYLSKRGRGYVKEMPPLMEAHFKIIDKLYDPDTRPEGYINMGTAENHLADPYINPLVEAIQRDMPVTPQHTHYDFSFGTVELRSAIADYWMKNVFSAKAPRVSAENVIVTAGCSVALEFLATMLGDEGDVFLVPTPFYSGFLDDMGGRVGLEIVGVDAGAHLDIGAFEEALARQKALGKHVVGVLLSSPNNPVGTLYSAEEMTGVINFCMKHEMELISDELYSQTVYAEGARFVSAFDLVPAEYLNHVHVTGSFSKDFALSGFRCGFVFTFNTDMLTGMHVLSYYANVSNHTQAILAKLLRCEKLPAMLGNIRRDLRINAEYMAESLAKLGVKTAPAQSGVFVFSDFSPFMEKGGMEGELQLWDRFMSDLKINITPGFVFRAPTSGFFRICCAHPKIEIDEACRRFATLRK